MRGKTLYVFFIPILITFLFSLMSFLPVYQTFENRLYDLFLAIRPEIAEDERLLLLDVDDLAISEVGVWPWSRDIMANGLLLLREFDAGHIVFDIEYTEESPLGVNSQVLRKEIPELFQQEFRELQNNIDALFNALTAGQIPLNEAESYIDDLQQLTEESRNTLLTKVRDIERDNDAYFGKMAHLNGRSFFTTSALSEEDASVNETLIEYAEENVALTQVTGENPGLRQAEGIRPAIYPILSRARGAGFPNVRVDPDGVRRRIDLLIEYQDKYFPQLAFAPLLQWLGNPEVELGAHTITLRDAGHPDRGKQDIKIPLTETNHLLINWPQESYEESFRHLSYYELVYNRELEQRLIENLNIMDEAGYLAYHEGDFPLMDAYNYAEEIKHEVLEGGDPELMDEYIEVRRRFFSGVDAFLQGPAEATIDSEIDRMLSSGQLDDPTAEAYREIRSQIPEVFSAGRDVQENLASSRARLAEAIPDSFIIIGFVGTSTTDIGVTPFDEEYMNVGTHASLANTILQENFLDELPEWYSMVLGLLAALLVTLVTRRMTPVHSLLFGVLFLLVIVAADLGAFVATGVYLPPLIPMSSVFFTFLVLTAIQFLQTSKDRLYIKNAFSHYLSTDVINELLSDPEKLSLGGDKKHMTALFTDVKGFSTISEQLDPTELVSLLNQYLSEMSDVILEQKGTIDKYEGDAIISFFGAPLDYEDHAARACRSAIRMKKAEEELNRRFLFEKLSPVPVFTRIGINTGEMVVGNMGTVRKMDYTIMGNSVNLAARLEGVNKQYGTWILASEPTFLEAGGEFVGRKLDRVRVVGIKEAVRLYELIDERSELDPDVGEALEIFEEGLQAFEQRDYDTAQGLFSQVLMIKPEDGPSQFYLNRCNKFKKKAPPESWDGVFNLTLK
ncbi:MAG: CHASE2 domain-containing protein [Spirochaetaceae bacterium]|nr:CHASE2 domain-containing protein [Spirochaetaceae bacterium]MCF7949514.1 CHASE2 domain-containing protein [Spirochaetia bacterium]MCF7951338.1 CHASE2 domain-containing protein [Spirochaetaceae bacterium]